MFRDIVPEIFAVLIERYVAQYLASFVPKCIPRLKTLWSRNFAITEWRVSTFLKQGPEGRFNDTRSSASFVSMSTRSPFKVHFCFGALLTTYPRGRYWTWNTLSGMSFEISCILVLIAISLNKIGRSKSTMQFWNYYTTCHISPNLKIFLRWSQYFSILVFEW